MFPTIRHNDPPVTRVGARVFRGSTQASPKSRHKHLPKVAPSSTITQNHPTVTRQSSLRPPTVQHNDPIGHNGQRSHPPKVAPLSPTTRDHPKVDASVSQQSTLRPPTVRHNNPRLPKVGTITRVSQRSRPHLPSRKITRQSLDNQRSDLRQSSTIIQGSTQASPTSSSRSSTITQNHRRPSQVSPTVRHNNPKVDASVSHQPVALIYRHVRSPEDHPTVTQQSLDNHRKHLRHPRPRPSTITRTDPSRPSTITRRSLDGHPTIIAPASDSPVQ